MTWWVSRQEVSDARRASPRAFLVSRFGCVRLERGGRTVTVPGVLRTDLKGDRWVACGWAGEPIGDNIALARSLLGCDFVTAVRSVLSASPSVSDVNELTEHSARRGDKRPCVPPQLNPDPGRAYLAWRRLRGAVVLAAEQAGALRHLPDGVVFLGRDRDGAIRSATKRFLDPAPGSSAKRDFLHSDKLYPCVLPGAGPRLFIVEGGVSGLAVQEMARRDGFTVPPVVVTGGSRVIRWIGNELSPSHPLVRCAADVAVIGENERNEAGDPDPSKQATTDAARETLVSVLTLAREGAPARVVRPPAVCKDAADWLLQEMPTGDLFADAR